MRARPLHCPPFSHLLSGPDVMRPNRTRGDDRPDVRGDSAPAAGGIIGSGEIRGNARGAPPGGCSRANETQNRRSNCVSPHFFQPFSFPAMPRRALHHLARRAAFATAATSPRGPFSTLTPADVAAFRSAVGDAGVVTDPVALAAYNT